MFKNTLFIFSVENQIKKCYRNTSDTKKPRIDVIESKRKSIEPEYFPVLENEQSHLKPLKHSADSSLSIQ
jgi:hypothetical protein